MTFASVCSGIGAPECAWLPAWDCVFNAEIEPFPCAVLDHRFPITPNYGDITRFKEWPEHQLDVLIGGTPCQSFSVAGLRKGMVDPRGNLALTFLAIVDKYAPTWFVWENVPGVLSSNFGRDFGAFLGGVAKLGYGFAYRILDAQFFGLAQRRKRVFVVGCAGGQWQRAASVLFERESLCGNPAQSRESGEGTAHSTCPSLTGSGRGVARPGESRGQDPVIPIQEIGKRESGTPENGVGRGQPGDPMFTLQRTSVHGVAHSLCGEGFDASEDGTGRGVPLVMAHGQANAEIISDGSPSLTCNHEAPICFQEAQTGVREYDSCGTLRANGPGHDPVGSRIRLGHAVRRLTPRECERLQGFPDDWTAIEYRGKPAADGNRYKALGNSMAVPCIKWIGKRIQLVHDLCEK